MNITEAIAVAAIEYICARTYGDDRRLELADEKLFWMVLAKEHGWSPGDFESDL